MDSFKRFQIQEHCPGKPCRDATIGLLGQPNVFKESYDRPLNLSLSTKGLSTEPFCNHFPV
ncbi:MAG TPA: hypothetical protein V6C98_14205 [Thermosynechococcaceae cyanobacterium]